MAAQGGGSRALGVVSPFLRPAGRADRFGGPTRRRAGVDLCAVRRRASCLRGRGTLRFLGALEGLSADLLATAQQCCAVHENRVPHLLEPACRTVRAGAAGDTGRGAEATLVLDATQRSAFR